MTAAASSPSTVQIVATIVQTAGVIVALAALVYTVRRDRAARLAEIRTGFLRDAYLKLAEITSRRHITPENSMGMTLALKDIQLLGTPEQIALADAAALSFAEHQHVDLDPLLDSLHQDLRALLGMKPEKRSRIVFSVQPPDAEPREPS
jgi:hypothetical protein